MDREGDIDRNRVGDRLSERNVTQERVSAVETNREMSAMLLDDYDVLQSDK